VGVLLLLRPSSAFPILAVLKFMYAILRNQNTLVPVQSAFEEYSE